MKLLLLWSLIATTLLRDGLSQKLLRQQLLDTIKSGAMCADHSPGIFYTNLRQNETRWLIFFESGGVCASQEQCRQRLIDEPHLMSSRGYPAAVTGYNVLSDDPDENPYSRFNRVLVPYCSADLFLGDHIPERILPHAWNSSYKSDDFAFAGRRIAREVLRHLAENSAPDLRAASKVVFAGSSAGGIAALNHVRWAKHRFFRQDTDVSMLLDSSLFVDYYGQAGELFPSNMHKKANLSSLRFCRKHDGPALCCTSAACMLERRFVPDEVRIMLLVSRHDVFILGRALTAMANDGLFDDDADATIVKSAVSQYAGAVNTTLSRALYARAGVSVVEAGCTHHMYLPVSSLWTGDGPFAARAERVYKMNLMQFATKLDPDIWSKVKVQGRTLKSIIWLWSQSANETIQVWDSCKGLSCNPSCPEQILVTSTLTPTSTGLVKWLPLGLCVFVITACCLLKFSLWLSARRINMKMMKYIEEVRPLDNCECLPEFPPFAGISVACYNLTYALPVKKDKALVVSNVGQGDTSSPTAKSRDELGVRISVTTTMLSRASSRVMTRRHLEHMQKEQLAKLNKKQTLSRDDMDSTCSTQPHSTGLCMGCLEMAKVIRNRRREAKRDEQVKVILNGATSYFNSGELVAIMGPSGSGKTTFMDLITGRKDNSNMSGDVLINGQPLRKVREWYSLNSGYVLQLATPYYEELTVRSNLLYSAMMSLPARTSQEEIFQRVEMVIQEVGLASAADTVVGGVTGGGLSGGQKRRLAVAIQLINLPGVLFLDEPTSGLDAHSSLELLRTLSVIAKGGRLVILSIHQPRLEIYHMFDSILFLCAGRVAYYGSPVKAPQFFMEALESITSNLPSDDWVNPADTILDLLNEKSNQKKILEHYSHSSEPGRVADAVLKVKDEAKRVGMPAEVRSYFHGSGMSVWRQLVALEGRLTRLKRGQKVYLPLIIFTFGLGIGTSYLNTDQAFLVAASFNLLTGVSFLFITPSIINLMLARTLHLFHLEHNERICSAFQLVLHLFCHAVSVTFLPLLVLCSLVYFMVSPRQDMLTFLLVFFINLTSNATCMAIVIFVTSAVPQYAVEISHIICGYVTFFEGFLYTVPNMAIYFSWLIYPNPYYWAFSAEMRAILEETQMDCKHSSKLDCLNQDGDSVLKVFGFEQSDPYRSFLILLAMMAGYLCLAVLVLMTSQEIRDNVSRCVKQITALFGVKAAEGYSPGISEVDLPESACHVQIQPKFDQPAKTAGQETEPAPIPCHTFENKKPAYRHSVSLPTTYEIPKPRRFSVTTLLENDTEEHYVRRPMMWASGEDIANMIRYQEHLSLPGEAERDVSESSNSVFNTKQNTPLTPMSAPWGRRRSVAATTPTTRFPFPRNIIELNDAQEQCGIRFPLGRRRSLKERQDVSRQQLRRRQRLVTANMSMKVDQATTGRLSTDSLDSTDNIISQPTPRFRHAAVSEDSCSRVPDDTSPPRLDLKLPTRSKAARPMRLDLLNSPTTPVGHVQRLSPFVSSSYRIEGQRFGPGIEQQRSAIREQLSGEEFSKPDVPSFPEARPLFNTDSPMVVPQGPGISQRNAHRFSGVINTIPETPIEEDNSNDWNGRNDYDDHNDGDEHNDGDDHHHCNHNEGDDRNHCDDRCSPIMTSRRWKNLKESAV